MTIAYFKCRSLVQINIIRKTTHKTIRQEIIYTSEIIRIKTNTVRSHMCNQKNKHKTKRQQKLLQTHKKGDQMCGYQRCKQGVGKEYPRSGLQGANFPLEDK